MTKILISHHRSVPHLEFEAGPFTVLFGKNNAGKTNLLEAIYGVLAPESFVERGRPVRGLRGDDRPYGGAVYAQMERGLDFDDAVLALIPDQVEGGFLRLPQLPPGQVCFACTAINDSLPRDDDDTELWFVDLHDYWEQTDADGLIVHKDLDEIYVVDEQTRLLGSARLQPLFLSWEFNDVDQWVTSAIAELSAVPDHLEQGDNGQQTYVPAAAGFLERIDGEASGAWRIRPEVYLRLAQLATLATHLLPDFLDGEIHAQLTVPTQWHESARVRVEYQERGSSQRYSLEDYGRGAARWTAIAVQIALHVMEGDWTTSVLPVGVEKLFSGRVLLVDEPEAHLHPSAVASAVRWCQRMVNCGFQVLAASHHEEFLRASGDDVRFVRVIPEMETWTDISGERHSFFRTSARTLTNAATPVLQELAAEVGMHPATALSLQRAILFVEGPLDEAVLDEYAGPQLDAAGVVIIPIHGTKNLEGLIDGEFTTRLGIKAGVLTDNTRTASIWERSNKKRSSEETKLVRLIKRFQDQGLTPPDIFGVEEDDLLFALPADAIRQFLAAHFPGWRELREECRAASGLGPSDSVDWKSFAEAKYGLPIANELGVRSVIRTLDLAAVDLPSIRAVVDEIVRWAKGSDVVA